jgi:hypothetical protein
MISRHMQKYIPGHPTIVVDNMSGAGSLPAANHIFEVAKPNGLTFGHFSAAVHRPDVKIARHNRID